MGTSITPGNNTYGSYASLIAGASVTDDVYGFWINFNSNGLSATARDALATVGLDAAGGTSFTDTINHLGAACADVYGAATGGIGLWYYFPLFIKSGTSIGVKASVNNATVGTLFSHVVLQCQPTRSDLIRMGSFVRTFGDTAASSAGTAITQGGVSEGAYVQLGSALVESLWFWNCAVGANATVESTSINHVDLAIGAAGAKKVVIANQSWCMTNGETARGVFPGAYSPAAIGDLVYGRAQASAVVAGKSLLAYGVGG